MFGQEYLDWCSEVRAGEAIDAFLSGMEPEDRVWALAVMRQRHEVRVEYREHPLSQLGRITSLQDSALQRAAHRQSSEPHSLFGGAFGGLLN